MGGNCTSVFVFFPVNGPAVYIGDHQKLLNKSISPVKASKKKKKSSSPYLPSNPPLRRPVITDTFHGPLLTGFDCIKSDVLAVMQNIHSGKYKNYYWVTVQNHKILIQLWVYMLQIKRYGNCNRERRRVP